MLFDLESDGKDPEEARIITACAASVGPAGAPPGVRNWMAQPERDIPAEATEVHGITTERARAEGEAREVVVGEISAVLAAGERDVPVTGHNLTYDCTLLDREMRRLGIGSLSADADGVAVRIDGREAGRFWAIDTMILDKAVDPFRPGPRGPDGEKLGGGRKLTYVAGLYGVPLAAEDAHAADADALAAGRVAWAIARRCDLANGAVGGGFDMDQCVALLNMYAGRKKPNEIARAFAELGRLTLPELHRRQTEWAAEQADGLRQWFTKSGEGDASTVDGSWPLRPMTESADTGAVL